MSAIVDYQSLNPDRVLSAVDSAGFQTDGRMLEMNSFENRVFQIGLENEQSIVAKFYRPERWSDAAILEEHEYSLQLASQEISLVPPIIDARLQTLHYFEGFRFSLFERQGGRPPDFESHDQLRQLGRFIGRMHAIGQKSAYQHPPTLDATTF